MSIPLARSVGDTKLNGQIVLGCSALIDGISDGVIVGTFTDGTAGTLTDGTAGTSASPNGHNIEV